MVESFSFYAKFPGKAAVSALCLDHYVTDSRPIICIGSQQGDIAIYYLDHVNSQGKVCQKHIISFNFFERGVNKLASGSESGEDEDSLLNSRSNTKTFLVKVGSDLKTPPDQRHKQRLRNSAANNSGSESQGTDSQDINQ